MASQMSHTTPKEPPASLKALAGWYDDVVSGKMAIDEVSRYGNMLERSAPFDFVDGQIAPKTADTSALSALAEDFMGAGSGLPGIAGIIAGRGAKTADLDMLALAERMKGEGASADDIYANTKWWLDHPDGQPRFEIDDAGFDVTDYSGTGGAVTWQHPGLRDSYEKAWRLGVKRGTPEGTAAYRHPRSELDMRLGDEGDIIIPKNEVPPNDVFLHELQHYTQGKEGFARGGSWHEFIGPAKLEKDRLVERAMSQYRRGEISIDDFYDIQNKTLEEMAMERYSKLAGESEARMVEGRMDMTPEERMARPFWNDYDVPLDEQIVRMEGGAGGQASDVAFNVAMGENPGYWESVFAGAELADPSTWPGILSAVMER